jgi:flagellar basal-body rod protein FlgC
MTNALGSAIKISSSGLFSQAQRISVVSENIANASSASAAPGGDAYRRKTISFEASLDRLDGERGVRVAEVGVDTSDFKLEYAPSHPAADDKGFVKMPNVDMTIELADMREAARSYQANVQVIKQARELISMTINLLGGAS